MDTAAKDELKRNIDRVARATGEHRQEVMNKLIAKDHWTWFLIREAKKANAA